MTILKYLKSMIVPLGIVLVLPLLLGIINLLGVQTNKVVILIIMAIGTFISGFYLGRNSLKKGYLQGALLGIILSLILFLFSLLFKNTYTASSLIYYIIIVISSMIGASLGIQKNWINFQFYLFLLSIMIVIGPSFVILTFISAPNTPGYVLTFSFNFLLYSSYSFTASSPFIAFI